MFGTQHLALFIASGLLLNITPGQDTLYIVGRTVSQGRRAGVLSVLGISSGTIVHTLAATFGLAAILAASANAYVVIKLVGAAYLAYLGVRMIVDSRDQGSGIGDPIAAGSPIPDPRSRMTDWSIYRAGLLTNVLNPKVALFFLAFLPQFVAPTAESRVVAFLFLGAVFVFNGTLWCFFLVWAASAVNARLRGTPSSGLLLKRAVGAMFVGLGVRLAVSK
jgi:threonine/homoserine/homoserine lactone efflux protein